ncbi:MAG: GerMN domain-containing protein [Actinomycetia bacterium]|nr:GerMN domain-containing protein [Actinomycetes bacterium]
MSGTPIIRMVFAVTITAIAAAACGIGTDSDPRALPVTTSTTTTEAPGSTGPEKFNLYFVQADSLVPVARQIPARTPTAVIESLLVAPDESEGTGLSSSIPAATRLLGLLTVDGLVEVDLSEDFEDVVGPGRSRAIGQMVMSVTALEEIDGVRFSIEGDPIDVNSLDPERGIVSVVDACDYFDLLAEPQAEDLELSFAQRTVLDLRREDLRQQCNL